MDKYEFNIKVEQIKKMVTRGDFETSMRIADTIDWRRVRSANLLSMISQVYEKNGEYQEAKEVLLLAYERAPIGKRLLFKLTELALKEGSIREAEDYYREFCDLAQDDSRQYLLRYLILKEKKVPVEQLIGCLEHYVSQELDERWMYELASLYERAGQQHKCVQMCDRIMLMFAFGKYVDKAMDLKVRYAPLSEYQLDLMKNRGKYEAKLKVVEQKFDENTLGGYEEDEDSYFTSSDSSESYKEGEYTQDSYSQGSFEQGNYASQSYSQGMYGQDNFPQDSYAGSEYGQGFNQQEPYAASEYGQGFNPQDSYVGPEYGQGFNQQDAYARPEYGQGTYPQGSYTGSENGQGIFQQGPYPGSENGQGIYQQGTYTRPEYGQSYQQDAYIAPEYRQGIHPQDFYGNPENRQDFNQPSAYPGSENGQGAYQQGFYTGQENVQGNFVQEPLMQQAYVQGDFVQAAQGQYSQDYSQQPYFQGISDQPGVSQGQYSQNQSLQEGYVQEAPQQAFIQEDYGQETIYTHEGHVQNPYVPEGYPKVNIPQEQYPQEGRYQGQRNYFENEDSFSNSQNEEVLEETSGFSEDEVPVSEETIDEELVVNFHQDHIEHELAKEMSKISEEITIEQESVSMQTKVPQPGQDNVFQMQDEGLEEKPEDIPEAPMVGHLLIEAKTPEKGLETAIEILKQIHAESGSSRPVAKITGSKLNQKGISNIVDMLAGKDLVVEEAGDLSNKELIGLQQLVSEDTSGMNIILIDNPRQLEELYHQNPELTTVFECVSSEQSELSEPDDLINEESHKTIEEEALPSEQNETEGAPSEAETQKETASEMDLEEEPERAEESEDELDIASQFETESEIELEPKGEFETEPEFESGLEIEPGLEPELEPEPDNDEELDIDDFAEYATQYAGEIDCSITGKSMLALYERIEIMEEDGIPLTRANAEELIETAADRAEKPPISKLIKGMFSSKYDKEGLLILREEHFI